MLKPEQRDRTFLCETLSSFCVCVCVMLLCVRKLLLCRIWRYTCCCSVAIFTTHL